MSIPSVNNLDSAVVQLQSQDLTYDLTQQTVTMSTKLKTPIQQAFQQVMTQGGLHPYVFSINGVTTDSSGQFLLLGSGCVSITDSTDNTDPATIANKNQLVIFDGCRGCNNCQTVWQLLKQLQQCRMWAIGMKDCQLYYQNDASALWSILKDKRITDPRGQCTWAKTTISDSSYRSVQYGRALKLLYQYKALIAMWNYMAYNLNNVVKVQPTQEQFTGFVMQAKRSFNFGCGQTKPKVKLTLTATFQQGQDTHGICPKDDESQSDLQYDKCVYVDSVPQNTYLQYDVDTGLMNGRNKATGNVTVTISGNANKIVAQAMFDIKTESRAICSFGVKVLPVLIALLEDRSDTVFQGQRGGLITLQTYAQNRRKACTVDDTKLTQVNRWQISSKWQAQGYPVLSDTTYYTTGFGAYPSRVLLFSQSEQPSSTDSTQQDTQVYTV